MAARFVEQVLAGVSPWFTQHATTGLCGNQFFNYTGEAAEITQTFKKAWLPNSGKNTILHAHALVALGDSNNTDGNSTACHKEWVRMNEVKDAVKDYTNSKMKNFLNDAIVQLDIRDENGAKVKTFDALKLVYKNDKSQELKEKMQALLYELWELPSTKNWARLAEQELMMEKGYRYLDENDPGKTEGFIKGMFTSRLNCKRKQVNDLVRGTHESIKKRKSPSDDGDSVGKKLAQLRAKVAKQKAKASATEGEIDTILASMNSTEETASVAAMPQAAAATPKSVATVAMVPVPPFGDGKGVQVEDDDLSLSGQFDMLDANVGDLLGDGTLESQGIYVDNANAKKDPICSNASLKKAPITTTDDVESESDDDSVSAKTNPVPKKNPPKKKATPKATSKKKATPKVPKKKHNSSKSSLNGSKNEWPTSIGRLQGCCQVVSWGVGLLGLEGTGRLLLDHKVPW